MHQQAKPTQRPSPAASRFYDRLEELFNQLKDGLKMVDTEELVALLEELVERVDSRMVARYGHGMCPCPSPSCKHQQKDCGLSTSVNVITYSRTTERYHDPTTEGYDQEAPFYDQSHTFPTKEKAKKIVMNAVNGALAHAREAQQCRLRQEKQYETRSPTAGKPVRGGNVLSNLVRQPATNRSPTPYRPARDVKPPQGSDALAFETVTAGNLKSNRVFALRREARGSLKRYTHNKQADALMTTMRLDDTDEEQDRDEIFYDAEMNDPPERYQKVSKQGSSPRQSNKYSPYSSRVEGTSQTRSPCDCVSPEECKELTQPRSYTTSVMAKYTYPGRDEVYQSGARFSTSYDKSKSALIDAFHLEQQKSPQSDEFGPLQKPQSKGSSFKRVLPPRSLKTNQATSEKDYSLGKYGVVDGERFVSTASGTKGPSQVDDKAEAGQSSDEDVWWNARDRFSSGNIQVQASPKYQVSIDADKFIPANISSDSRKEAVLRTQGTGVIPSEACWDTNLIYSVHRTLRESLPKFTGSKRRASCLMQVVGSLLNDQEQAEEDFHPQYNFSVLQELRGEDRYGSALTAGDASATIATQTSTARNVSERVNQSFASQTVDVFRDALHCRCAKTTDEEAFGRSQNEIMKVLKDSRENIKVELTLDKDDEPKLAEFVSCFIEAQRRAKHTKQRGTGHDACSECGRSLRGTSERHGNRLTTNNNRSSTPCSPVRSPSPPTAKTTVKSFPVEVDQVLFDTSETSNVQKDSSAQESMSTTPSKEIQDSVLSRSSSDPGIQRSLSPFPDNHSEGYSSTHEGEENDFTPSQFLEKNSMYSTKKSKAENAKAPPSISPTKSLPRGSGEFQVHPGLKDVELAPLGSREGKKSQPPLDIEDITTEKEVKVTNKGSFLGEICGCN